nr:prepilin-type N-terminal cleavage/methylation domain-containing protein [Lysinibacillus timonensis]
MSNLIKNEKGLTLVELLAVIIISAILIILAIGIFSNGQNQAQNQVDKNNQLMDIAYVLKALTKEMRKTDIVEVPNSQTLKIKDNVYAFNSSEKVITKDEKLFANHINQFEVRKEIVLIEDDNATGISNIITKIIIEIESVNQIKQKTEIVLRR